MVRYNRKVKVIPEINKKEKLPQDAVAIFRQIAKGIGKVKLHKNKRAQASRMRPGSL